jgi:hypothetical protein
MKMPETVRGGITVDALDGAPSAEFAGAALASKQSRQWCGYWQRGRAVSERL